MRLDLYHILNPLFEMTIGSQHYLRQKIEQVASDILDHIIKLAIFPSTVLPYKHWRGELAGKIAGTIFNWRSSKRKFLPRGHYTELIYSHYLDDQLKKFDPGQSSLQQLISNFRYDYPNFPCKYHQLTKKENDVLQKKIYSFVEELDKLITNSKEKKIKSDAMDLIDKYFPE